MGRKVELSKQILLQYRDVIQEIYELQQAVDKCEDAIEKLIEEGTVVDKVSGGEGGIQGFKIEGFPVSEYNRRRKVLRQKRDKLLSKETELQQLSLEIEKFVEGIADSRDRRVIRKTIIDGMSQQQIADEMYMERSNVSKILSKYC